MDVKGRKIWLIGASEGIGRALAQQLHRQGAELILSARTESRLNELTEELQGASKVVIDVCAIESVTSAWQAILAAHKGIDSVIYCAGYYDPMTASNMDLARVEAMLDVNTRGLFRVLSVILPWMIKADHGHLLLIGSIAGYRGLPMAMGYGASKAAVQHVAENLVCDLRATQIKVQICNPGFVLTRLTNKNKFWMPQIITPERAASFIAKGIQSGTYEIRFPWGLSSLLKFLRLLPFRLYFGLLSFYKIGSH